MINREKEMKNVFVWVLVFACGMACKPAIDKIQGKENIEDVLVHTDTVQGIHLIHDVPALTSDNWVNVVIEIPSGTSEKWEVEKSSGNLSIEQINGKDRKINYLAFPFNYGMIPQTFLSYENGGDGDPLDVIVLGEALQRGHIVPCKILGVVEMLDAGEKDDKLIAVSLDSHFSELEDINHLRSKYPGIEQIIYLWFENYKGDQVKLLNISDAGVAKEKLNKAIEEYQLSIM